MNDTTNLAKSEVIKTLQTHLNTLDPKKHAFIINALKIAINEVGKCTTCRGRGLTWSEFQPNNNYKIRVVRNQRWYGVPCINCDGSGHELKVLCDSCGKTAAVMSNQEYLSYCSNCETKHKLNNFLI